MSDKPTKKRRRGRPLGYTLSKESRLAISLSKLGHQHTEETKSKISKSLIGFYKRKYPLSEELLVYYHDKYGEDIASWVAKNKDDIDELEDVVTDRCLLNYRRRELEYNTDLGYSAFAKNYDALLDLKKLLSNMGLDVSNKDVFDTLNVLIEEMYLFDVLDSIIYLLEEK